MTCLVSLLELLPNEVLKEIMAPKFVEFCIAQTSNPKIVPSLADHIGPLSTKLEPFLYKSSDLENCINCYCSLASQGSTDEMRLSCARNFPAMLQVGDAAPGCGGG